MNTITAGVLDVAYLDEGAPGGWYQRGFGAQDPLKPGSPADQAKMFTARHEHRVVDAGHNLPQEAPEAFADAVLTVHGWL